MTKHYGIPIGFTDYIGIETTRNFNEYAHHGVADTFTVNLIINGETVQISKEQSEALLRNSREVAQARENHIIQLLEAECTCNEDAPFCWAAKAIDLINKDKDK